MCDTVTSLLKLRKYNPVDLKKNDPKRERCNCKYKVPKDFTILPVQPLCLVSWIIIQYRTMKRFKHNT